MKKLRILNTDDQIPFYNKEGIRLEMISGARKGI
jgi:hypothetical protein